MREYLLFDLDGTLTDPRVGITRSVQYALRKMGIEVEDADTLCCFIGPPLLDGFMRFYGMDRDAATQAIAYYREYFPNKGIFENEMYEGIDTMLEALRAKGYTLLVATSKPTVYASRILDHFGLTKHFAYVAGSELDGTRSRKGEVIAHALEEMGITNPSLAAMVGDKEHDIIGSKETGLYSVGVLYGYGSLEELEAAGADAIVPTVAALGTLLSTL